MVETPVDFNNLRTTTDRNPIVEAELLKHFLNEVTACICCLWNAFTDQNDNAWRNNAHTLKGLCYNLGATQLGHLCAKAQQDDHAPAEDKASILVAIVGELSRGGDFLGQTQYIRSDGL